MELNDLPIISERKDGSLYEIVDRAEITFQEGEDIANTYMLYIIGFDTVDKKNICFAPFIIEENGKFYGAYDKWFNTRVVSSIKKYESLSPK